MSAGPIFEPPIDRAGFSASPRTTDADVRAAREEFPGTDFRDMLGGWMAVPAGADVVQSMTLAGVLEKLRARDAENPAPDEYEPRAVLRWHFPGWVVSVCDGTWEAVPREKMKTSETVTAKDPGSLAIGIMTAEYYAPGTERG